LVVKLLEEDHPGVVVVVEVTQGPREEREVEGDHLVEVNQGERGFEAEEIVV
jgi:hypothetical protein